MLRLRTREVPLTNCSRVVRHGVASNGTTAVSCAHRNSCRRHELARSGMETTDCNSVLRANGVGNRHALARNRRIRDPCYPVAVVGASLLTRQYDGLLCEPWAYHDWVDYYEIQRRWLKAEDCSVDPIRKA